MADPVSCSFMRRHDREITQVMIPIPNGTGSAALRLLDAAARHAVERYATTWAVPATHQKLGQWFVLGIEGVKIMPTREAAEMLMLHRG